jgi:DNA repair ATPase RecN
VLDRGLHWYPAGTQSVSLRSYSSFTTLNQEKNNIFFRTNFIQKKRRHFTFRFLQQRHQAIRSNQSLPRMEDAIKQLEKQLKALTIQVTDLKAELRRQNNQDTQTTQKNPPILFRVGDRIRILNKVKRPSSWDATQLWDYTAAKKATVTSTTVYFTTDNGISTWRLHKHLRHE